jgi:GAF domain-containing protein
VWTKHFKNQSLSKEIIRAGQIVYVPDTTQDDRVNPEVIDAGIRSFLGLPIPGEGRNLGVLYVYSRQPGRFDEGSTVAVLQTLAGQAGLAIANARAFEAEAQRRQEAETLRETALVLTTTLEQQEVFERILSELQKVVPYDSASVQLLKGDRLEIIGGRGFPNLPEILGLSFPIDGDNPNREVVRRRDFFIVADAPAKYKGFTEEPHVQAGIRGWLGVPMLIGDQLIGMIALDKRQPGFYTEEHARLAQTFAAQAAIAIENARLYQEAKEGQDYIRSLYEASSAIIALTEPKQVLQAMVDTIRQTSGAWRAVVLLVDEGEEPQVLAQRGFDLHLEPATSIRQKGISRQVIQTKQPRFFPDIQAASREVHPKIIEQGVRAAACLSFCMIGPSASCGCISGSCTLSLRPSSKPCKSMPARRPSPTIMPGGCKNWNRCARQRKPCPASLNPARPCSRSWRALPRS